MPDEFKLKPGQKAAYTRQMNRANKRILADRESRIERRSELQKQLYGSEQPSTRRMREEKPHLYAKTAGTLRSEAQYRAALDRFKDIINNGTRGAQGEELKTRILKALRNEGYVPPNGYRVQGEESGLADFIENELTAEEVEVLYEGSLNFSYSYTKTDENKEKLILRDILRYTNKEQVFVEKGYAERYNEWLNTELNESASTEESDELDRIFGR